jgi:hypothetical protein
MLVISIERWCHMGIKELELREKPRLGANSIDLSDGFHIK